MKTLFTLKEVGEIPQTYGVYLFLNSQKKPVYIGKSVNLKKRVQNHLQNSFDTKTIKFVSEAMVIKIIPTQNEFDAIILEARLVKTHQPLYNIELKDDKGPSYIVITDDLWPMVKIINCSSVTPDHHVIPAKAGIYTKKEEWIPDQVGDDTTIFGPYLKNNDALSLLRYIRQIIPFATHRPQKKVCLYRELGLCDPCPSEGVRRPEYLKNIQKIKALLSGRTKISRLLIRDIKKASQKTDFEKAQKLLVLQQSLTAGEHHSRELWDFDNRAFFVREQEGATKVLQQYFPGLHLSRVECFDASHHWGQYLYVGMVVFKDGLAQKDNYRLFSIKTTTNNDPKALQEALARRLKHLVDWGRPDLIIIDGGLPQLSAVGGVLRKARIPYMGLAKKEEILHIPQKNATLMPTGGLYTFVTRVRDEAHRFSITKSRQAFRKNNL